MIFFKLRLALVLLNLLWSTANANYLNNALNSVNHQLNQIKVDQNLGLIERYAKVIFLNQILKTIREAIEFNEAKKDKELNDKTEKLKNSIYNQYLASRMGASSFGKDFHTVRYLI